MYLCCDKFFRYVVSDFFIKNIVASMMCIVILQWWTLFFLVWKWGNKGNLETMCFSAYMCLNIFCNFFCCWVPVLFYCGVI
jgi:hypothetical protein